MPIIKQINNIKINFNKSKQVYELLVPVAGLVFKEFNSLEEAIACAKDIEIFNKR